MADCNQPPPLSLGLTGAKDDSDPTEERRLRQLQAVERRRQHFHLVQVLG
jgi:hypothetical protein